MSEIHTQIVKVTTTGSAGTATGSADSETISGFLLDIYLDFHGSAPGATTDVAVAYTDKGGNVLATANTATDVLLAPRQKLVDNANAAITDSNALFPLNGKLTVSVAQADALTDCVVAYIRFLVVQ